MKFMRWDAKQVARTVKFVTRIWEVTGLNPGQGIGYLDCVYGFL
jgi:hypothetical protein